MSRNMYIGYSLVYTSAPFLVSSLITFEIFFSFPGMEEALIIILSPRSYGNLFMFIGSYSGKRGHRFALTSRCYYNKLIIGIIFISLMSISVLSGILRYSSSMDVLTALTMLLPIIATFSAEFICRVYNLLDSVDI